MSSAKRAGSQPKRSARTPASNLVHERAAAALGRYEALRARESAHRPIAEALARYGTTPAAEARQELLAGGDPAAKARLGELASDDERDEVRAAAGGK